MADVAAQETWRERARAVGLPLWRLAIATGVSPATVAAYANGARRPNEEWLKRADAVLREREVAA